jgi:signal transduction histidine kinase
VTELAIDPQARLGDEDERLVYRAAVEALRNVHRHAHASHVSVTLTTGDDRVRLEVADDGEGFSSEERAQRREEGHVGLTLIEELAVRSGASVDVRSTPGEGTTFALELPRR